MATIKICDMCKKEIHRRDPKPQYTIKKWNCKMEICCDCMNKFCEWAGLPLQYKPPLPPKLKNGGCVIEK